MPKSIRRVADAIIKGTSLPVPSKLEKGFFSKGRRMFNWSRRHAAVLSQLDESTGKLRPIQFFSSSLSSTQKNYSAGQLEAWALVAATRKWSVYLKAWDNTAH